jgi:hypothetical protein
VTLDASRLRSCHHLYYSELIPGTWRLDAVPGWSRILEGGPGISLTGVIEACILAPIRTVTEDRA